MSRNKLPNRKRKRVIKKYVFLCSSIVLLLGIIFGVFLLFAPKASFISPLPKSFPFQQADENEQNISRIKQLLAEKKIDYQSVVASGSSYFVTLPDAVQVVMSSQKNLDLQISSLQFVMSRLTMEGKPFRRLDLRFDKPVVNLQ